MRILKLHSISVNLTDACDEHIKGHQGESEENASTNEYGEDDRDLLGETVKHNLKLVLVSFLSRFFCCGKLRNTCYRHNQKCHDGIQRFSNVRVL